MPADKDLAPAVFPPAVSGSSAQAVSAVAALADIPEEDIWLVKQKSKRTRRAYKQDVQHFMRTLTIRSYEELLGAVRLCREKSRCRSRAPRHQSPGRLNAGVFPGGCREALDKPDEKTLEGLRDRAILAVGLQVGLRRAEIAALTVEDLHQNRGYDSLRITRKGGRHDALAVHPNTAKRLKAYMETAGHADDLDGPLFRPLSHNRKKQETRRHMHPDAIDRVLRKYAKAIVIERILRPLDARHVHHDGAGEWLFA